MLIMSSKKLSEKVQKMMLRALIFGAIALFGLSNDIVSLHAQNSDQISIVTNKPNVAISATMATSSSADVSVTWNSEEPYLGAVYYDVGNRFDLERSSISDFRVSEESNIPVTKSHSVLLSDVIPGVSYSYVVGKANRSSLMEIKKTDIMTIIPDFPDQTKSCQFIDDFMRAGDNNDIESVRSLQTFLRDREGMEIPVNGQFDEITDLAVKAFQEKYAEDILQPWNISEATGYVYITTKKKLNELYCNRKISLSSEELAEIADYSASVGKGKKVGLMDSSVGVTLRTNGVISGSPDSKLKPEINKDGSIAKIATTSKSSASVTDSGGKSFVRRIFESVWNLIERVWRYVVKINKVEDDSMDEKMREEDMDVKEKGDSEMTETRANSDKAEIMI